LTWIADIFDWFFGLLDDIDFTSLAFSSMQVDCQGSKAPAKLLLNICLALMIVLLFESHFIPFLRITFEGYATKYQKAAETKKDRIKGLVLKNCHLGCEASIKYLVQLMMSLTKYSALIFIHPYTSYCQSDATYGPLDMPLAIGSTILTYIFGIAIIHCGLRCFIWGLPHGIEFEEEAVYSYFSKFWRRLCCHTRAVHFHQESFYSGKQIGSMKKILHSEAHHPKHEYDDDLPCLIDIIVLVVQEAREKKCETLRNYFLVLAWKLKQLCKLTVGYWDEELIRCFHIVEMAERLAVDEDKPYEEVLVMYGQSNSLIWQMHPVLLVLSKLGEYANGSPLFVKQHLLDHTSNQSDEYIDIKLTHSWFNALLRVPDNNIQSKLKYCLSLFVGRAWNWAVSASSFVMLICFALFPGYNILATFSFVLLPSTILNSFNTLENVGLLPDFLDCMAPGMSLAETLEERFGSPDSLLDNDSEVDYDVELVDLDEMFEDFEDDDNGHAEEEDEHKTETGQHEMIKEGEEDTKDEGKEEG